jgi:hypothetical protein
MAVPGQAALKADGCFGNSQFGVRRLQPYPPRSLTCASRVKPPSTGLGGATRDVPALEVPVPATEPERKRRLFGVRPAPAPAPVSVDVERAAKGLAAQVLVLRLNASCSTLHRDQPGCGGGVPGTRLSDAAGGC